MTRNQGKAAAIEQIYNRAVRPFDEAIGRPAEVPSCTTFSFARLGAVDPIGGREIVSVAPSLSGRLSLRSQHHDLDQHAGEEDEESDVVAGNGGGWGDRMFAVDRLGPLDGRVFENRLLQGRAGEVYVGIAAQLATKLAVSESGDHIASTRIIGSGSSHPSAFTEHRKRQQGNGTAAGGGGRGMNGGVPAPSFGAIGARV